jgi:hypothetical protein
VRQSFTSAVQKPISLPLNKRYNKLLPYLMKRSIHATLLRNFLLTTLVAWVSLTTATAQTSGQIIRPALNGGELILDPNGDNYVSVSNTGFPGTNDIGPSASEIPYRAIPTLRTEPLGDIRNGEIGGHTDFAGPSPLQAYYNGQHLMFRMRLGGTSTARRGYSVLIDTDGEYAGTGANPGFEYEVVFSSGFDVKLIRHTGNTQQTLLSGASNQFSQRSVAATTAGGDADFFVDFYVPLSSFGGAITPSTPLRMVGSTVNLGQSALTDPGVVADVAGVDFRSYNLDTQAAWRDIIETFPPITPNNLVTGEIGQIRTIPPYINSPITTTSTSVAGTSREPAGTVIRVFRNGGTTPIATTTVTADGTWVASLGSVTLSAGDLITATATATGRPVSLASTTVVVIGEACATPIPTFSFGQQRRAITGSGALAGATIRIYRNGVLLATETANNGGNWTYRACPQGGAGTNNCIGTGEFTVTQQPTGGCESVPSTPQYNLITQATPLPTLGPGPVCVSTTTLSGTAAPGAFVTLFLNGRPIYLIREPANAPTNAYTVLANEEGNWTLNADLGYAAGDELYVRARTTTNFYGQSTPTTVVATCQTPAPVITGDYCGVTTTVTGTSESPAGTVIRIYVGGEALEETGIVNQSGFWTVTGIEIPEGTAFTARATAPGDAESEDSEPVIATSQTTAEGLSITTEITETTTSISGTGIPDASLTLYIAGTPFTPIVIPPSGEWTLTGFATRELFPGAEVSATQTVTGQCESELLEPIFVQCLELTNTFTLSSDADEEICGGSGTVSITLGGSQRGVAYTIILPNDEISGSSVMGTGGEITLTSGPITNNTTEPADVELRILARRVTGALGPNLPPSCETILLESITRTILPQPATDYTLTPQASTICAGSDVDVLVSSAAAGYTYQFINEVTGELVGDAVEGVDGPITLSTGIITGNHSYGVVITNLANGCVFTDPGRYTATISGPAIDRPFLAEEERVCVGGSTTLFISTQTGAFYNVYLEGNPVPVNGVGRPIAGRAEGVRFTVTTPPAAGTYTYYVTVYNPTCPTPVRFLQTATVETTDSPATAEVGDDTTVCGDQATLVANQAAPGIGTWSVTSQPEDSPELEIINANNPVITVNNLSPGIYVFRWTVEVTCGETVSTAFDEITVTVNCPSFYVILPPKYRDEYVPGELLADAEDPDGGISAAQLLSGTLPPGVLLNEENGDIFVGQNPEALQTGMYTFTVRLTDAFGFTTDVSVTIEILENSPIIIPLPVELVYFTATVHNNQAHLEWLTASEQDNDRFEIERSLDAKSFEKIGTVKGKGTTSLETKYKFTDRTPVQGTVYYRLKQVDFDGEFAYSNVIAVTAKGLANELATQVYPNPFQDRVKVMLTSPNAQQAQMVLYDMNGKRVLSKTLDLDAGINEMELQLQQLGTGMYILKISGDGMDSTTKIIKN